MSSNVIGGNEPLTSSPTDGGWMVRIGEGYKRILRLPGHVKTNYYDGSNKYKTVAMGIGIGTLLYLIRKFYRSCKNAGGVEKSFIRGFVSNYWVPVLDDLGIIDPNHSPTTSQERHGQGKTWHYSHYADIQLDNIDTEASTASLAEGDRNAPPEVAFLLQATRVLGQFESASMVELWKSVETVTLSSGDILFTRGDPDDQIYILIDGLMEIKTMEEGGKPLTLKVVHPGGQLFSILSFLDVITGNSSPIKTVEAVALTHSSLLKIPSEAFRELWMNDSVQMRRSIRRLIRRVYQVVFIALHKVLGLTSELVTNIVSSDRPPIDHRLRGVVALDKGLMDGAVEGLLEFFNLSSTVEIGSEPLFANMRVLLLRDNFELLTAGSSHSSSFVFVYKGELEVSRIVDYEEREEKEHEQVMFYVTEGQGLGGLSYLTDDVNIFTVRVPQVAIIVIVPEEHLVKICDKYPLCLLPIANSVVVKLSSFTRQIDFGIEWIHVNSGSPPIYRVGESSDCTYLVLSGRLRSILNEKGKQVLIGEYGKNDWIGLVETLTKRRRSKMVLPVRDSELAKIPEGVLHMIKLRFPIVTIRLLDFLGNRVAKTYRSGSDEEEGQVEKILRTLETSKKGSSTIALLPSTHNIPILPIAYEILRCYEPFGIGRILRLEDTLRQFGPDALSRSNDYILSTWLANQEETHGLVIYVAEKEVSQWSLRCTRQADTILILASAEDSSFAITPLENMARSHAPRAKKELVLLHLYRLPPTDQSYMPSRGLPKNSRKWLDIRNYLSFHHHIRIFPSHMCLIDEDEERIIQYYFEEWTYDIHSDIARLTRWISGNSTGLVLGGGGAKGAAHIGILQSILDHGIPIDLVCGVSIGSFVGALYAAFQDVSRVDEYAKDWFNRMTEVWSWVMDLTVPVVSILEGEAFNETIKASFGEIQMEDLWLPFFCLSTDITGTGPRIHRCGTVWKYCRASMTLAGYFPPMCDPVDGHYLMDGGYTNLVPANLMREFGAKFIIAVDVSSENDCGTTNYGEHLSGLRILAHKFLPFLTEMKVPNLFKLQSQLSFIQSALYLDVVKKMDAATIYLRPPIDKWTAGDFSEYKEMKYTGFRYASEVFHLVVPHESLIEQWISINPKAALIHDDKLAEAFAGEKPTTTAGTKPSKPKSLVGMGFHGKSAAQIRRRITLLQD